MSEEQAVNATEEHNDAVEIQDDSDFEAGFSGTEVAATETPANTEAQTSQEQQTAPNDKPQEEQTNAGQQSATPDTVSITREQFERLTKSAEMVESLTKQQDRVNGTLGSLKQALDRLQQETPSGQQVEVSEADFEDLAKEFPDLAGLTIKGLNKVLGKMRGTGGQSVDPKQIESVVQERITQGINQVVGRQIEQVLGDRHPDWKDLRDQKPADYQEWLQSLPEADRANYLNSDDPYFVAKKLDGFKAFRAKRAEQKAPQAKSTRKEIIQAAVAPRGTGGQPPAKTGDDDFESGFKKYASTG
jgi:hypothetical protein